MASDHNDAKDGWSSQKYNKTANFVYSAAYTSAVLDMLDAKPGEKIVDFGCGTGELTKQLAQVVGSQGDVVGYDASQNMVDKARANGVASAYVSDLQQPEFFAHADRERKLERGTQDAVFSNATLHWCNKDPAAVARNAYSLLKPGGRFVAELGGFMNCVGVVQSLYAVLRSRGHDPVPLDPWYFPSTSEYQKVLESAGLVVSSISLHPRLTPLNGPLADWLELFARPSMLREFDEKTAKEIVMEVQNMCERDCKDADGNWAIMYCRLRFRAEKPQ
ncbi:S-adenosyl-L-methionine-dependent methyltransferase [Exidia glandulosa HHB12029]|uniref:S-adenosyl-L-methionine-dependent methyltransferase n=1 Tax=Exidia glandulosa HHB12029 TaxID=1314781 RepID=A0A166MTJ8_EXIGL|nr:S-adenosyl-L-methionine-dependent methyltransferase [Exidia glandulosa HHB12029]